MSKTLRLLIPLALCFVLIFSMAVPAFAQRVHVVKYGETLSTIAYGYGTTWQAIAAANSIVNPSRIYAGQVLVIPAPGTIPGGGIGGTRYTVRFGDTLSGIAARYGVTLNALYAVNPGVQGTILYVGTVLNIPTGGVVTPLPGTPPVGGRWHYIQPGQNMFQIARLYGRDIYDIARANRLLNLNLIFAGTWLRIP
jgi:LysM repeat protein